ncbi:hypothetical protein C8R44DRAFT_134622 [Mycena epipterygia]|nr:hypothetical protein C8R44DRAFT_134622 [Mycena epipterygia]
MTSVLRVQPHLTDDLLHQSNERRASTTMLPSATSSVLRCFYSTRNHHERFFQFAASFLVSGFWFWVRVSGFGFGFRLTYTLVYIGFQLTYFTAHWDGREQDRALSHRGFFLLESLDFCVCLSSLGTSHRGFWLYPIENSRLDLLRLSNCHSAFHPFTLKFTATLQRTQSYHHRSAAILLAILNRLTQNLSQLCAMIHSASLNNLNPRRVAITSLEIRANSSQ